MNSFICVSHDITAQEKNELNKLTLLPMCGFIAQLVEHRTGIAEVMGSNPVEALIFFRLLLSNCLNWKIYCDDHTSLSYPWVGRCGLAPHTLTLFKTNITDFPTLFKTELRFLIPCLRHLKLRLQEVVWLSCCVINGNLMCLVSIPKSTEVNIN